jgi:hypothetical protein
MMKNAGILAVVMGVMTLLGGLPASAQVNYSFDAPSSFYAGNAKMPPGAYTLRQTGEQNIYELQSASTPHSVMLVTRQSSKTAKGRPEVVFNKYGDTDYLEGVATSTGDSVAIDPSAAEKIAAKKATAQPHSVTTK